jgi:hypothetical protein
MPEFFICESGPMGGASIIFVCNDEAVAVANVYKLRMEGREVWVYRQLPL